MVSWELYAIIAAACLAFLGPILVRRGRRAWILRNVPGPRSVSFLTGIVSKIFSESALAFQEELFVRFGRVYKIIGFLGDPQLVISDPKALAHILIREADAFELPTWFIEGNILVFGPTVVSTVGSQHGAQRRLLAPVFGSSANVQRQTQRIHDVALELKELMFKRLRAGNGHATVDLQDLFTRLSLECIARAALGHSFDSFSTDHPFLIAMKEFVPVYASVLPIGVLAFGSGFTKLPSIMLRTAAALICIVRPSLGKLIDTVQEMHSATARVWNEKKRLYAMGDATTVRLVEEGKDLLSVLLRAYATADQNRVPDEEILAHIRVTMFAGSDTTASALSRTIQLLTEHVDVQDALREELLRAGPDVDVSTLPLLDAVCKETLRLYPPAQISQRVALKDTLVPLASEQGSCLLIPTGTQILLNIRGSNTDTDIWGPDGGLWRPSRWLEPMPESIRGARIPGVYANTMTFLGGGRACIGFKFSQLVMKMTLAETVPIFRFARAKAKIDWRYCGVVTPGTQDSVYPSLPVAIIPA